MPGAPPGIEVRRLLRSPGSQWREVTLLDLEGVTVLLEEEPDPDRCDGGFAGERLGDDRVEVEELDELQRPPHFLEAAADVRSVDEVDEGSLERRDPHRPPSVPFFQDAGRADGRPAGRTDREEGAPAEGERRGLCPGGDVESVPHRVRPAPVLERGVKRDGCVRGQLGRDEVRVRGEGRGLHPARNDGVEAPPNAKEAALAQVVREQVRPGPGGGLVPDRPEAASGEDGVRGKEIEWLHLRLWSKRHN